MSTCVFTVGAVYILAERPAGLAGCLADTVCSCHHVYFSDQPVLNAGESGMRHLRWLKQLSIMSCFSRLKSAVTGTVQ